MSNYVFQKIIDQYHDIINETIGVVNKNAIIVACSDEEKAGSTMPTFPVDKLLNDEIFVKDGITYIPVEHEFAVFVNGTGRSAEAYAKMISVAMINSKSVQAKKYDKSNFMKSIILDNVLFGDIYLKAHDFNIKFESKRVCLLIKTNGTARTLVYDVVSSLFPEKDRDFVVTINETDLVLVKEIDNNIVLGDLEKLGAAICDTLSAKYYVGSRIGIGRPVEGLKDLASSFKEAQMALEVGKISEKREPVVAFEKLGIARLIYQLPTTICQMFLKEVFKKGSIEALDQEILFTVQSFFENDLNVSETSRKLFVHRNTLVYRLEKIYKITGLDLRKFENAVLFKVAMMVNAYLSNNPIKY